MLSLPNSPSGSRAGRPSFSLLATLFTLLKQALKTIKHFTRPLINPNRPVASGGLVTRCFLPNNSLSNMRLVEIAVAHDEVLAFRAIEMRVREKKGGSRGGVIAHTHVNVCEDINFSGQFGREETRDDSRPRFALSRRNDEKPIWGAPQSPRDRYSLNRRD